MSFEARKPLWGYILFNFNYMILQGKKNKTTKTKVSDSASQGQGAGGRGKETVLYDTTSADVCHSTFATTHRTYPTSRTLHTICGLQLTISISILGHQLEEMCQSHARCEQQKEPGRHMRST